MKKIFLVLFSLIMMCSVSFGMEPFVEYIGTEFGNNSTTGCKIGNYTSTIINDILQNYRSDNTNENYKTAYDTLLQTLNDLGYQYIVYEYSSRYYLMTNRPEYKVEFVALPPTSTSTKIQYGFYYEGAHDDTISLGHIFGYGKNCVCSFKLSSGRQIGFTICEAENDSLITSNSDIYKMTYVSSSKFYWDGASYYYEIPKQGENSGNNTSDFTDEQIAEIVERFVNSNARIENMPHLYTDFFITYDNLTGYYRAYTYMSSVDLAIEYGNYDEEGNFVTTGTEEGEAWQIRPYVFGGNIFERFNDWISYKRNEIAFKYFSISPDSSIEPHYIGTLEYNYCSNYRENEVVIYSTKQIRYVGEKTNSEGKTETEIIDDYIPKTILTNSVTGEEIIIRDNLQDSSNTLEEVITPNADFSGLKQAFEKYISFVNISSITWLTTAISSMIAIFVPFVALGIIIFLINRILNGGS